MGEDLERILDLADCTEFMILLQENNIVLEYYEQIQNYDPKNYKVPKICGYIPRV